MFIASDRNVEGEETKFDFFDMDFKHLPFTNRYPNATNELKRPESFEKMKHLAEKLSEGIPQVRIDYYDINGDVFFEEITFSHWSVMVPFNPEEWDKKFGEWIKTGRDEIIMFKYIIVRRKNDYGTKAIEATYQKLDNVVINIIPVQRLHGLLWVLYKCHNTPRINNTINLPFRGIWAKTFLERTVKDFITGDEKICFVFSGMGYYYEQMGILDYLRKKYKGCKIICSLGDKMGLYEKQPRFSLERIKETFDLVCTYNKIDAEKYGLLLTPPKILDYEYVAFDESIPESDVIFVGQDKGRLNDILHVYEVCRESGLKCDFHIVGVPEEKQKYVEDIEYNRFMSYDEVMRRTKRSRCILNLMQSDTEGFTLRDYEAIGMNKMLITNNAMIFSSDFYTPDKVIDYYNIGAEISKINEYRSTYGWNGVEHYSAEKYFQWLEERLEG